MTAPLPQALLLRPDGILGRIMPDPAYKVDEPAEQIVAFLKLPKYQTMTITAQLGIDIAKQKFDVVLTWTAGRRAKVFRNDLGGWQALLTWLRDLGMGQVHACLEATGRYGEGLALALHEAGEAGHRVSVVNPAQIKHFVRTKLGRNKSDRVDAALISGATHEGF